MASNRERVLIAAIEILASEGIRALTHRHVDQCAALPEGSTSNVFRTRDALLLGVTERMVAIELPVVAELSSAVTQDQLADSLVALFEQLMGPFRTQTAARLTLFVEAAHDEALRAVLSRGRANFVGPIRSAFAALRASNPDFAVQLIGTCFQGMFLQQLGGYADVDPRPIITAAVQAALAA